MDKEEAIKVCNKIEVIIQHGMTVRIYVTQLRLRHAHGLLENHDYPLRVVCEMVGYQDAEEEKEIRRIVQQRRGEYDIVE